MPDANVKVIPLAVTKVDWASFHQFAQSTFGINSINESDETIRFINLLKKTEPKKNPYNHLYLTVGIEGNQKILNYLYECNIFKIWSYTEEENIAIIISTDFLCWKNEMERACRKESDFKIRVLFNKVFLFFERGCYELVKDFQKMNLPDNSFFLERKR